MVQPDGIQSDGQPWANLCDLMFAANNGIADTVVVVVVAQQLAV